MSSWSAILSGAGIVSIFCSILSLCLTFLRYVEGDAWAPTRTGGFLLHVFGVNLADIPALDLLGMGSLAALVDDAYLYQILFILGLLMLVCAAMTRVTNRD